MARPVNAGADERLAVRRTGRFGIVQAAVVTRPELSPNARLVYVGLTLYAGGTGQAWPSPTTLATQLGLGRSTVYRALDELEAAGIIIRDRRTTGAGADRPTLVTIVDEHQGVSQSGTGSVPERDGSVPERDTTSVPERDTNKDQRTRTRARASASPDGLASPARSTTTPVPDAATTQRLTQETHRRRGLGTDHAAGAERARAALRAALVDARHRSHELDASEQG